MMPKPDARYLLTEGHEHQFRAHHCLPHPAHLAAFGVLQILLVVALLFFTGSYPVFLGRVIVKVSEVLLLVAVVLIILALIVNTIERAVHKHVVSYLDQLRDQLTEEIHKVPKEMTNVIEGHFTLMDSTVEKRFSTLAADITKALVGHFKDVGDAMENHLSKLNLPHKKQILPR